MTRYELRCDEPLQEDPKIAVEESAHTLGLVTTQVTTLVKYPGCTHWHFKRGKERGILEATYWPEQRRAWLSYRAGREADWIVPTVAQLKHLIETRTNGD